TALLVAAGEFTTPAALLSKGVLKVMFLAKLKTAVSSVLVAMVLGVGGFVYCAGGGQASPPNKPPNELEALRRENELLKVNLRVTLEKIQALEADVRGLKERVTSVKLSTLAEVRRLSDSQRALTLSRVLNLEKTLIDNQRGEINFVPDPIDQVEVALKLLRQAPDAKSRERALSEVKKAIDKLNEQSRSSLSPNAAPRP